MSQVEKWPVITKVKDPMPGHEDIKYDTNQALDKASRIPFKDITNG